MLSLQENFPYPTEFGDGKFLQSLKLLTLRETTKKAFYCINISNVPMLTSCMSISLAVCSQAISVLAKTRQGVPD